ncbi:amidase [Kitasatospora atroaurantiaca]|uniref:Amidase n=1 Tax=Kitasatospora atroaurantiaca TaxID=285545 RepID=A0A561EJV6_9ACTN|nr:amidase [Kitasatospora atroaurantiaca]TWE15889.1 amidase [Kitasatospora atroaurantiaca]
MTNTTDIAFRTAAELTAALRRREISSVELLDHYLGRIEKLNPAVNAVSTIDPEQARAQARTADAALARGERLGPLHGLPMTVKDTIETAGIRTTAGAPELADHLPERDADSVARLRAAGAVILGKTNVPGYARDVQTYNPLFGTTNNPWNQGRAVGGSSGGGAAALAAGLTGFEVGSDLAGSIRNPAHYCGVYALRPSFGIVPSRGHIPRAPGWLTSSDMMSIGPLGRGPEDLDLGLDVLAGPASAQAVAWRLELPRPRAAHLDGYRVGVWLDDPYCPIDTTVGDLLAGAVAALRAAGARTDERTRPVELATGDRLFQQLMHGTAVASWQESDFERSCALAAGLPADADDPGARFLRNTTQRLRDWHHANEQREQLRAVWAEYFRYHDVLLCPVTPTAAIPHDHNPDLGARRLTVNGKERPYWDQSPWTGLASLAHLPAAVAPVGLTPEGLPVGIQIIGPHLEDRTVTDLARHLTRLLGGFQPPPQL